MGGRVLLFFGIFFTAHVSNFLKLPKILLRKINVVGKNEEDGISYEYKIRGKSSIEVKEIINRLKRDVQSILFTCYIIFENKTIGKKTPNKFTDFKLLFRVNEF